MTRRLILWLTGLTVLLWLVAAGLGALLMREEFDEVFDSALSETAQRLLPLAIEDILDREPGAGSYRLPASPGAGDDEYLTFQVRDASGAVLLYSYGAPAEPFAAPLVPGYHDTPTHRVFTTSAVDGTILLQVADPLAHRRESMAEGLAALMLPLIALIPLSVVAVGLVVRRALKPIGRLSSEIEARSGANLTTLQTGGLPPELSVIAASVNGLLERLRRAMEAERSFTTNSAHELRTPLAGALAQTQRLIEELEPGPQMERARRIEGAIRALTGLSEKLLQLARAEAGIGTSARPVALEPVVRMVADEIERTHRADGSVVVTMEGPPLVRAVDVDAFAIAIRNLIENAIVHGSRGTRIDVRISGSRIDVANASPVISAETLQGLIRPFERGGSQAPGTGLGLAIVDALARQMGAKLELASPSPGRADGFTATLDFTTTDRLIKQGGPLRSSSGDAR